jgi:ADP-heptose:LPS heptosyltransferase
VRRILVWHQGGLGDLLLSGPAFMGVAAAYPAARLAAVGYPARWQVFQDALPLTDLWPSSDACWSALYQEGPPPPALRRRLADIDLAWVFTPRENPAFLQRLLDGGVGRAVWVPSFPLEEEEHVVALQARRLAAWGLKVKRFRLQPAPELMGDEEIKALPAPLLAVAPGSGAALKNWPLSHYYELTRTLAWEQKFQVVWLLGPAEAPLLPYISGLAAAQGHLVWMAQPLRRVATLLSRSELFVGGDSGLTHLAAAAGAARVVALYGPTNPRVWAPLGEQVTVVTPPGRGPTALADLPVAKVLEAIRRPS